MSAHMLLAESGCHINADCAFPAPGLHSFDFKPIFSVGSFDFTKPMLLTIICMLVIVFSDTTLFNGRAFALSLLVTALAWVGGQVKQSLTSRMLYVDPVPSVPAKEADPVESDSGDAA